MADLTEGTRITNLPTTINTAESITFAPIWRLLEAVGVPAGSGSVISKLKRWDGNAWVTVPGVKVSAG